MGPGDLRDVLESLRDHAHPDLLVGLGKSDDAAVYRVSDEVAVVSTVDFFAPIVDDPYLFGAIAAANAMSDVYAMGGEVLFALNLAGFPREMSKAVIAAIFKGGADKVLEAGGGGGGGGGTGGTGGGRRGQAAERVEASGAGIALRLRHIPLLPGALELAEKGQWSGGMKRNRQYLEGTLGARGRLSLAPGVSSAQAGLLFESETSGGLLFGVAREDVQFVLDGFARRGEPCWEIGEVAGGGGGAGCQTTCGREAFGTVRAFLLSRRGG